MSIEEILKKFEEKNFFNDLTIGQWDNANANAPLSAQGCRREADLVIGEINRTEQTLRDWLRQTLLDYQESLAKEDRELLVKADSYLSLLRHRGNIKFGTVGLPEVQEVDAVIGALRSKALIRSNETSHDRS